MLTTSVCLIRHFASHLPAPAWVWRYQQWNSVAKSACFKVQKMALRAPKSKNGLKNLAKHPLKWWGRHLVHAFPFLVEHQANFVKLHILYRFGPILEGEKAEN